MTKTTFLHPEQDAPEETGRGFCVVSISYRASEFSRPCESEGPHPSGSKAVQWKETGPRPSGVRLRIKPELVTADSGVGFCILEMNPQGYQRQVPPPVLHLLLESTPAVGKQPLAARGFSTNVGWTGWQQVYSNRWSP